MPSLTTIFNRASSQPQIPHSMGPCYVQVKTKTCQQNGSVVKGTCQGSLVDQHSVLGPHMRVVEKWLHKVVFSSPHVHHSVEDNPQRMCICTHTYTQIKQCFVFFLHTYLSVPYWRRVECLQEDLVSFLDSDVCFRAMRNVVDKHDSKPTFSADLCMHVCLYICMCHSTQFTGVGSLSAMWV